jgi:hypothetical protein
MSISRNLRALRFVRGFHIACGPPAIAAEPGGHRTTVMCLTYAVAKPRRPRVPRWPDPAPGSRFYKGGGGPVTGRVPRLLDPRLLDLLG